MKVRRSMVSFFREVARVAGDPTLLLWTIYVFMMPIYVFSSGLPQPGDALILLVAPLALRGWDGRLIRTSSRPLRALAIFTAWVCVVDFSWAIILGNFGLYGKDTFFLFPIYYVYNAIVFLVACVLYQRYGVSFLWLTLHVVFGAALFQVAASFVVHGHHYRGQLFFNNPNQLGFYALLSASIIALGKRKLGFGIVKASVGLTACLYLALLSASKAAVAGSAILFVLTIVSNPKVIIAASLAVGGLLSLGGPVAHAIDVTQQRIQQDRYPQYTFFEERGYDRILANKQYWLLGAGEGGTSRFADTTVIGAHEVHSSAGTVFFSYGIIGVFLFVSFIWRMISRAPLRLVLMLIPPLAYTVAHQGLRATLLWILFGMFVALKHLEATTRPRSAAARPPQPPVPAAPPARTPSSATS